MKQLDFWFEFASTYSYPAAMRIETLAQNAGISVRWRPFLLGPIFGAQGWTTSPFNLFPVKGAYMWRDMERICAREKLPWKPGVAPFPQNGLLAARCVLALPEQHRPDFIKAVYSAQFGDGLDIAGAGVIGSLLTKLGHPADQILACTASSEIKVALKNQSAEARSLKLFGAPSFITSNGELFWGNDRLEEAVAWEKDYSA